MVPTGRHVNQLVAQARATKEGKENFSETNRVVVSLVSLCIEVRIICFVRIIIPSIIVLLFNHSQCLPEQRHYYLMPSELQSGDTSHDTAYPASICGAMLSKVVFCHPVHLFSIIPVSYPSSYLLHHHYRVV